MTRDYRIVLPLMAAVGLSIWLVELRAPSATSGSNLPLDLSVEQDQSLEILPQMLVVEVMSESVLMLPATMTVLTGPLKVPLLDTGWT